MNYRLDIIKRNTWSEQSIKEHLANMITWFLDTFSLPEQYKEKANWNTLTLENTLFSPSDTDSGDMAEGNRPTELHINGEVIEVKTWQDVFIRFLKYLRDSPDFDFDFILENQLECFRRDDTIIKWSALKELNDTNVDLSNRYKTFDGKVWGKLKVLDDDILFIHINISASNCMTRISNVMDKFNMPSNSVEIKLK